MVFFRLLLEHKEHLTVFKKLSNNCDVTLRVAKRGPNFGFMPKF